MAGGWVVFAKSQKSSIARETRFKTEAQQQETLKVSTSKLGRVAKTASASEELS